MWVDLVAAAVGKVHNMQHTKTGRLTNCAAASASAALMMAAHIICTHNSTSALLLKLNPLSTK